MDRVIELLNSKKVQESPENRRILFNNPTYKPYLLLTYNEFRQLFKVDENNVTRFNKMIIYTEMDYYNYVYNQSWTYKWYPLLFKFGLNCVRRRPTSIIFSLMYLYSVEVFLEKLCLFQYVDDKLIDPSEYFTAALSKEKNLQKQNELFLKYKDILLQDYKEKHYVEEYKPRDWILMGNKFNIHNPYIHWTESKDENANKIMKEFFVKNFQLLLFFDRIQRFAKLIKNEGYTGLQRETRACVQNLIRQSKRLILEFPVYKEYVPYLNSYYKIEELLSVPYIDQRKRFIQMDHYKLIGSKIINLFIYLVYGRCEFVRYEFKWFDPNISAKKPMLRAESVWYDIVPYVVLLVLPTKVMGIRRAMGNAKKYADYASTLGSKAKQQTSV
ncbi:unnamed protein product [Paramecium octaurelia]|uniref:Uncharacterized protein n=1 Tax=Paramecium octaurelia TaxID=43137 RepID=A0A8S1WXA7_PAROT|nr:unnamed protein product [Paramecium octaurelia]